MKKIKYLSALFAVFFSILLFCSPVLAASAIVTSDPALNFDNNRLEQTLTSISDKYKQLNVVFYSNNSFSSNKAIDLNDAFIGSIKANNYITLFYNKDKSNPNKGTFSVNLGADYRSYLSKEDISNNIVKPNIGKFLPQNPEAFIPVVAEQLLSTIAGVKAFNEGFASFISWIVGIVCFIILFTFVSIIVKAIVGHASNQLDEYKKYKEVLTTVNNNYTKLVDRSTYLQGYTGATETRTKQLLSSVNRLNEDYLKLKAYPKFINAWIGNKIWSDYTSSLDNINSDLVVVIENIDAFIKSIEGLSGTDPLAEVIRLQELKDKQDRLDFLVRRYSAQYGDGSAFLSDSLVHPITTKLNQCLNSNESLDTKIDIYNDALDFINKEVILINNHHLIKEEIRVVANYIISNNNTYYIDITPIDDEFKKLVNSSLVRAINDYNYFESDNIRGIKKALDTFANPYKQQDANFISIEKSKAELYAKINITLPTKFIATRNILINDIREIKFSSNLKDVQRKLGILASEVDSLLKNLKEYNNRKVKLSKYKGTRKEELTKHLDTGNYKKFDTLVISYTNEDNRRSSSNTWSSSSSSNDIGFSSSTSSSDSFGGDSEGSSSSGDGW